MRKLIFFLPLAAFAAFAGFALWGLTSGRDPNAIPSVLVGRAAPAVDLAPVPGVDSPGFATSDLAEGVVLVNVFASWCVPCRAEHPVLNDLAEDGHRVIGIAYKDEAADTAAFLAELGNPYERVGMDDTGRAGIDWGISGVPETFVLVDGTVTYRAAGPLVNATAIDPLMAAIEAGS